MGRKSRINSYLLHILPLFVIILIVILILSTILVSVRQQAYDTVLSASSLETEAALTHLTRNINMLQSAYYHFQTKPDVRNVYLANEESLDKGNAALLYHLKKATDELILFDILSHITVIQFKKNPVMLIDVELYNNKKAVYKSILSYNDLDYETWQTAIFDERKTFWPATYISVRAEPLREYVTWNHYYSPFSQTTIAFSTLIPVSEIQKSICLTNVKRYAYALFWGDTLLCSSDNMTNISFNAAKEQTVTIDGERCYLVAESNDEKKLTLVLGIPESEILQHTQPVTRLILIQISACILIAIAGCLLYAKFLFRPVLSLMENMKSIKFMEDQSTSMFRNKFLPLTSDMQNLQYSVKRTMEQLESYSLQRAMDGMSLTQDDIDRLNNIQLLQESYQVFAVLCNSGNPKEKQLTYAAILASVRDCIENVTVFMADMLFIILSPENATNQIDRLAAEIHSTSQTTVICALSGIHTSYTELSLCSKELNFLLYLMPQSKNEDTILRYNNLSAVPDDSSVSYANYVSLTDAIRQGDIHIITSLFAVFSKCLFSSDTDCARLMMNNIEQIIQNAARTMGAVLPALNDAVRRENKLSELQSHAVQLCDFVRQQQQTGNNRSQEIIDYINEHYTDPDLSLTTLAEHFGISEKYTSMLIKQAIGINYSAYVESLRMRYARSMLIEDRMRIEEVIIRSGYINKSTFYKAFKRYWAVTPNSFHGIENSTKAKDSFPKE